MDFGVGAAAHVANSRGRVRKVSRHKATVLHAVHGAVGLTSAAQCLAGMRIEVKLAVPKRSGLGCLLRAQWDWFEDFAPAQLYGDAHRWRSAVRGQQNAVVRA